MADSPAAMKRSLSKNPNMLRTMIGTGLTLILVLSYAVYSATMDSEYYGYITTNDAVDAELASESEGNASWYFTTQAAITWVNFTVNGGPTTDAYLVVEAEGFRSDWYHSPLLGLDDGGYVCNEPESDYSAVIETCELSSIHSIKLDNGSAVLRGRVSLELPIGGKGYFESENKESAEIFAKDVVSSQEKTTTWRVKVIEGESITTSGMIDIRAEYVVHEYISVDRFTLDPVQETVYSIAALIGCFFLVLIIPLMIYYSAIYKERINEQIRMEITD